MTCQCRPACKWPSGGSAPGSIYHHSPGRGVGGVCPTLKQRKGPDTALSISLLGTEPPDVRAERPQAKEAAAVCLANSLRVIRRLLSWREVVGQQAERAPGEPALMRLLLGPHHGFLETGLQGPPRPSVPLPQARGGGGTQMQEKPCTDRLWSVSVSGPLPSPVSPPVTANAYQALPQCLPQPSREPLQREEEGPIVIPLLGCFEEAPFTDEKMDIA